MTWNDFIVRYKKILSNNYGWELVFAETVLQHVKTLDPRNVFPQFEFKDRNNRKRRIDFAIHESKLVAIAIEVDGYDKTGNGAWTPEQFEDFIFRQSSLTQQGWKVLRFTNSVVKNNPKDCIQMIEKTLANSRELEQSLKMAYQNDEAIKHIKKDFAKKEEELRDIIKELNSQQKQSLQPAVGAYSPTFEVIKGRIDETLGGLKRGLKLQTTIILLMALVLGVVVWKVWFENVGTTWTHNKNRISALQNQNKTYIDATEAKSWINYYKKVCGHVAGIHWDKKGKNQYTFLNFERNFPNQVFSARLPMNVMRTLNQNPTGKYVCVTGEIIEFKGKPTMIVNNPRDIVIE